MSKDDYIAASEIAEYLYCQRAWWLRLKGATYGNVENLEQGAAAHVEYAQQVAQVSRFERLGKRLILMGLAILIAILIMRSLIHT